MFGYPEALHALLQLGHEVIRGGVHGNWYLTCVRDRKSLICSVPVIVRVDPKLRRRIPWAPNNGDLHSNEYRLRSGGLIGQFDFLPNTSAWAFDLLLREKYALRRVDWPRGMYIQDCELDNGRCVVQITLSNGKKVGNEFHPDFADVAGEWEVFMT